MFRSIVLCLALLFGISVYASPSIAMESAVGEETDGDIMTSNGIIGILEDLKPESPGICEGVLMDEHGATYDDAFFYCGTYFAYWADPLGN